MKKTYTFLLICFCLSIGSNLFGQKIEEQNRQVGQFDNISVQGGIDLFLRQGSTTSVTVKANDHIINDIATEVEGNTLVIKYTKKMKTWGKNIQQKVYITVDDLDKLTASGGSDVLSEAFNLDNLSISASGGSDLELNLNVKELKLYCSGGSDTNLKGSADKLEIKSSGGSDLNAQSFKAKDCMITASGGADAHINVSGNLTMTATGASDIHYSGSPKILSQKTSGGADIHGN